MHATIITGSDTSRKQQVSVRLVAEHRFGEMVSSATLHRRPLAEGDRRAIIRKHAVRAYLDKCFFAGDKVQSARSNTDHRWLKGRSDGAAQYSVGSIRRILHGVTARFLPAPR
jgi:hypothetical protein